MMSTGISNFVTNGGVAPIGFTNSNAQQAAISNYVQQNGSGAVSGGEMTALQNYMQQHGITSLDANSLYQMAVNPQGGPNNQVQQAATALLGGGAGYSYSSQEPKGRNLSEQAVSAAKTADSYMKSHGMTDMNDVNQMQQLAKTADTPEARGAFSFFLKNPEMYKNAETADTGGGDIDGRCSETDMNKDARNQIANAGGQQVAYDGQDRHYGHHHHHHHDASQSSSSNFLPSWAASSSSSSSSPSLLDQFNSIVNPLDAQIESLEQAVGSN
jgi:hypothetical protein